MKLHSDYNEIPRESVKSGSVVTIGNFDGVHLGHQTIINNCLRQSKANHLHCIICTFEPHPTELFSRSDEPTRITTPARKQELLIATSPDILLCQRFHHQFAALAPETFATDALAGAMNAKIVVVGENFRFGKNRAGDIHFLQEIGETLGFLVIAENLLSTPNDIISSTRIRRLIQEGDVLTASRLLGRFHELPGTVIRGRQVGQQIGFPTINLKTEKVIHPNEGIYSAFVSIENDSPHPAAVYIGDRPTLQHGYSVEAHLLDFHDNIYGKSAAIHFVSKIRENRKFDSVTQLQAQISADVNQIRKELEKIA